MQKIDLQAGIKHLSANDKKLALVIAAVSPYRLRRYQSHFLALAQSIISQQISTGAAASIIKKFKAHYNGRPTAKKVATATKDELRTLGISNQKATYLLDLAQKIDSGKVSFRGISHKSDEEIIELLTRIKGIGVWTVHMFLIFVLQRTDVLPTGDLGIKKGAQKVYGLKALPEPADIEKLAKKMNWSPHRSLASLYLWRSLDTDTMLDI